MRTTAIALLLSAMCGSATASDWPKYCANLEMTGVAQSANGVSTSSVRNMALRWSRVLGGPIASAPTVYGGRVYIGDWAGIEWSIDAATGAQLGTTSLGATYAPQCNPASLGITSSAAAENGTLYLAGGDDYFYALDPKSMTVKWKQQLGDNSAGYYGWCSPAVAGGYVLQGVSSNCDTPFVPGSLVGMDPDAGTLVNTSGMMDGAPTLLGGGVWTSPAVDLPHGTIFVTTGSASSMDGHSYSIVRLALADLGVLDAWKIPEMTINDADWGTSPTLFKDKEGVELVGAGQKDGSYYAFNRQYLAGGPVWKTALARPGDCPQCGDGILSTAAYDGRYLYVGTGQPLTDPTQQGSVTALDPTDGHIVWQTLLPAAVLAPISFANGVVFTTAGKSLVAINATTGAILGTFKTQAPCYGGVAITDEGIYFGDLSGTLYCLAPTEPPRHRAVIGR